MTATLRRVVVSPVGRRRYVELLFAHLSTQRDAFDEWQLWMNTTNVEDQAYLRSLADQHTWITCRESGVAVHNNYAIHKFFPGCADPGSVYIRLDDDIVWLEPGFLEKMFTFRITHPQYFLVYANIVNNAILSHLHQRMGNVDHSRGTVGYSCMDAVGWDRPVFAEHIHRRFLAALADGTWDDRWHFGKWELHSFERVSINGISWLGSEFAKFEGAVGEDEEQWLSCDAPRHKGRMCCINGNAICAHFSFYTQRDHLDATDVLEGYAAVAPSM